MGTGYVRDDTSNNISDGNTIDAADLDGEFDALVSAFNGATGHTHDGTTGEGGPIVKLGPNQEITISATDISPTTTNTADLGTATEQWKDLYIDGVAYLDEVDIDGGSIDGTPVGSTTASTGNFTQVTSGPGQPSDIPILGYSADATCILSLNDNSTSDTGQAGLQVNGNDTAIRAGGSARLTVKSDGDVGIGTTSPENVLDVRGVIQSSEPHHVKSFADADKGLIRAIDSGDNNVGQLAAVDMDGTGTASSWDFQSTIDNIYLRNSGNVLVNTLVNPVSAKFHVNGDHSVTGDIRVTAGSISVNTTDAPTATLDVNGDGIRLRQPNTPASATATGVQGTIAWDSNYIYVCVATNTWKRAALNTW